MGSMYEAEVRERAIGMGDEVAQVLFRVDVELDLLNSIIDNPRNAWIFAKEMRFLRNALTHYLPDKSLNFGQFDQNDFSGPSYGLSLMTMIHMISMCN